MLFVEESVGGEVDEFGLGEFGFYGGFGGGLGGEGLSVEQLGDRLGLDRSAREGREVGGHGGGIADDQRIGGIGILRMAESEELNGR